MGRKDKITIVQAIKEVMIKHDRPMSPDQIYESILKSNLYTFGAVDPLHVVKGQIRKHCKGLEQKSSYSKTKYFSLLMTGRISTYRNLNLLKMIHLLALKRSKAEKGRAMM